MRAFVVVVALIVMSCGPLPKPKPKGGKGNTSGDETAAEYQRRKARESGELDDEQPSASGKWGGWKYQGERDDCRFVYGRKCFTKRESALNACKAAKCKTQCKVDGGGPATVSCSKS